MHLILVRHGETEWSRTGQHTGTTDLELAPDGYEQAARLEAVLARLLQGHETPQVYTSPLRRAIATARLALPAAAATSSDHLRECAYGAYEGLSPAQVRAIRSGWDFWRDGCDGGEDARSVGARADLFLASVEGSKAPIVAFSHGHMIRIMAARAIGLSAEQGQIFTLDTASVSVIKDVRGKRVVALWNLTAPPSQEE